MDTIVKPRLDELSSPRRNHFFYGKLLDELHLRMEQDYFNGKRWMLNREGLGRGVLCGLQVIAEDKSVGISPGVAIDARGREIVVPHKVTIDPSKIAADCATVRDRDPNSEPRVYLALCYRDCAADFVPALVTDCKPQDQCAPSTIVERYCLEVRAGEPPSITHDEALCEAFAKGKTAEDKRKNLCELLTKSPCAAVEGDACVVLATIDLGKDGTVTNVDCCTARERVYSNQHMFELLLCLQSGSQGPQGPAGGQGPKGDTGPGLESDLTRIVATSWVHGHEHAGAADSPFVEVKIITPAGPLKNPQRGLVIGFSGAMQSPAFGFSYYPPMFEAMVPAVTTAKSPTNVVYRWDCRLGFVVPVTSFKASNGRITAAVVELTSTGDLVAEPTGYAFVNEDDAVNEFYNPGIVLVRLRGDFVVDTHGHAVNAEFVRAQFPTGDGPPGTGWGLQGGTFESWFKLRSDGGSDFRANLTAMAVSMNSATMFEIAMVPGIGIPAAAAIVEAREEQTDKRFRTLEDLRGLAGIDERRLASIKPYITLD